MPQLEPQQRATSRFKPLLFRDGLSQLLQEGVVQSFEMDGALQKIPLLAAVGPLQFEVVQYRLESEYGAESRFELTPYTIARWFRATDGTKSRPALPTSAAIAIDAGGQPTVLFQDEWSLRYFTERNPDFEISDIPFK